MAYSFYERLSALDRSFLDLEDHNAHMHIGAVAVFDGGPSGMRTAASTWIASAAVEGDLHRVPRYRQRLPGRRFRNTRSGSTTRASTSPITSGTPTCRSRETRDC